MHEIYYIKDITTECFNDYFLPCKRKPKCKLKHVINWFSLFIISHNKEILLNEESLIYSIILKNRIFSYEKGFKLL